VKTVNSFIPWIGGKKLLRQKIIEMFPKEPVSRYIEVFGGAGWVLFGADKHAELEIFNDLDGNLINLYRCIKYHFQELKKEISTSKFYWTLNSRELFFD
jgi:DNA adenine methylase